MNARQWKAEVDAAFRAIYGCERVEGRPPAGLPCPRKRPAHVEARCLKCGSTFWRHAKANRQKWCSVCLPGVTTRRESAEKARYRARRREIEGNS